MKNFSTYFLAGMFLIIVLAGLKAKVAIFDEFSKGVEDALRLMMKIFPALIGLFVAVGLLRSCGILNMVSIIAKPIAVFFGIPPEVIPLVLLRPISGSASLAYVADIFKYYGPDSIIGRIASVMMGTTETIFYVLAVYFGAVGIKKVRYSLTVALLAELLSVILSCAIVRLWH